VLQQAVRTMFGPTNQEVGNPSWMSGAFEIGQITITYNGCGSSASRSRYS